MSTRAFLVLAIVVLLLAAGSSGIGALKRAPAFVRSVIDLLVIVAAVRIGLSVAIILFDTTFANITFPIAAGVLAAAVILWLRYQNRKD